MNDQRDREFVQHSIDTGLSSIQGDPWLARRIIANKEEKPVAKKISTSMILVTALLVIAVAAVAAGGYLGWFDFYSDNYGIQVSDMTRRIMKDSRDIEYTVGDVTFAVRELYCDGYTALISTQVSVNTEDEVLITGGDPYDTIGLNSESGNKFAEKLGLAPDTTWADAARKLNVPLYLVRASLAMPEELVGSEFMEDSMTDSDGLVTCFTMASLNGKAYGETVEGKIELSVWPFNAENPDDQSAMIRETHEISFMMEAPIEEQNYTVPENTVIGSLFRLDAVKGIWMPGGLYVVSSYTALDGATAEQAYELLDAVVPVDKDGEEVPFGLNLTGNIQNQENWPVIEMVRMTALDELPETLNLMIPGAENEKMTLTLELER